MAPARRRRVAAALVAVLALTGCGGAASGRAGADPGVVEYAAAQRVAVPAVSGELLDGARYSLAGEHGKVIVINVWGSWCGPCRAEAVYLETAYQATKAEGVAFLGVDVRDDRDKAKAFQEGRFTYPSLYDFASRTALMLKLPPSAVPATIVLDRAGRIAVVIRDRIHGGQLEPIIHRLAAESAAPPGPAGSSPATPTPSGTP